MKFRILLALFVLSVTTVKAHALNCSVSSFEKGVILEGKSLIVVKKVDFERIERHVENVLIEAIWYSAPEQNIVIAVSDGNEILARTVHTGSTGRIDIKTSKGFLGISCTKK